MFEELKANTKEKENCEKDFFIYNLFTTFWKISHQFSKWLKTLIKNKLNVDNNACYTTLKTGLCFQMKCSTPMSLISNIEYNMRYE